MAFESTTKLSSGGKVSFLSPIMEQLGMKGGDTLGVYADESNDKIFLLYKKFDKETLTEFSPVILNGYISILLPSELIDVLTLSENEVLSVSIDIQKGCIVLAQIPPNCVFCGELGDISLNGKHICPICVEKITLGEE